MRFLALLLFLAACAPTPVPNSSPAAEAIVIAHRGASGERPEHTLAAYELAILQGADFIEPDLVITKDNVLVARHENEISGTTDVADRPEFAGRRTRKIVDGEPVEGWFTEDFTLAELKTLRARERLPDLRGTDYDGRFDVPTFAEVLELARSRGVGIYPETKHPAYFRSIGLPLEEPLVDALASAGWNGPDAPVFIQSFEVDNLKRISALTEAPLVQLVGDPVRGAPADASGLSYAEMLTPRGLQAISKYAAGVGPNKSLVLQEGISTGLVDAAHAAGLQVHVWTFRAENQFLPERYQVERDPRNIGRLMDEICDYLGIGVDGVFTDHVEQAVAAVERCS